MNVNVNVSGNVYHIVKVDGLADDALAAIKAELAALTAKVNNQLPTPNDMAALKAQIERINQIDPVPTGTEPGSTPIS